MASPSNENDRIWCLPIGNTRVLCSSTRHLGMFPFTLLIGPNHIFLCVTYTIIFAPTLLFLFSWNEMAANTRIALAISIIMTGLVFSMVACSNPGIIIPPDPSEVHYTEAQDPPPPGTTICAHCQVRRPVKASHCTDCGVCIMELDHHCPWTGKCIGSKTIRWFYLFLFFITIHLVLSVTIALHGAIEIRS